MRAAGGAAALAVLMAAPCDAQRPVGGDRIAAVVNDDVITDGDVQVRVAALMERTDADGASPRGAETAMRSAVLQRLIEERLMLQEAKRLGLTASSQEVAERLDRIRQQLKTEDAFTAMLREEGLTEEHLKQELRDQILIQRAIEREVRAKIVVSPGEIDGALSRHGVEAEGGEEAQVRHLLVRVTPERPVEEARELATHLYERLHRGALFEELARTYSDDPHAHEGGLLGWVRPGQLLPELDAAIASAPAHEATPPVQTRLGFHLMMVEERRHVQADDAAASRRQVEDQVYQEKFREVLAGWLQRLQRKAYISVSADAGGSF
ncbi:MAG: peptidylprolyl isomerase [Candidatus Omnitrophica bacterium]|nr:peptidylprolyl isomerase [Candidatus Omnitrophota bacterium]